MKKSIHLNSRCLSHAEYDTITKELTLTFTNGRTYVYDGVSEEAFNMLVTGESIGRKFNSIIRGNYSYRER